MLLVFQKSMLRNLFKLGISIINIKLILNLNMNIGEAVSHMELLDILGKY